MRHEQERFVYPVRTCGPAFACPNFEPRPKPNLETQSSAQHQHQLHTAPLFHFSSGRQQPKPVHQTTSNDRGDKAVLASAHFSPVASLRLDLILFNPVQSNPFRCMT